MRSALEPVDYVLADAEVGCLPLLARPFGLAVWESTYGYSYAFLVRRVDR